MNAAKQEYAVVFPEYYFSQIEEAKHQPGTIAYSSKLMWDVFQETTAEMSRNGCKKIIAIPGHGGNTNMLQYFAQVQLESPKDYVLYVWVGNRGAAPPSGTAADARGQRRTCGGRGDCGNSGLAAGSCAA